MARQAAAAMGLQTGRVEGGSLANKSELMGKAKMDTLQRELSSWESGHGEEQVEGCLGNGMGLHSLLKQDDWQWRP